MACARTFVNLPGARVHALVPASRRPLGHGVAARTRLAAAAATADNVSRVVTPEQAPTYGLFVCSGSPSVAEALAHTGVDWLCLDMQHGPVGYAEVAGLLQATASGRARTIVRVGGPSDRYGMQQALDQGAGGVMVPLVNTVAEAREAVSYCRFPPEGQRSLVVPSRSLLVQEGLGAGALARYLRSANRRVQVWLQVESLQCLDALDDILSSVPGIDCMFLGPADMAVSMGLLAQGEGQGQAGGGAASGEEGPDLAAFMAGPEMALVHQRVLQTCFKHGVAAGCFVVGAARAREMAARGYRHVGFDTDTNMLATAAAAAVQQLSHKP